MHCSADFPAYCLNLKRRPDRRIQAWQQFRREGLEVTRIVAPDALPVEEARGWRNKGARACALAHRLAWREARRAGAEGVMVFEDDVVLCRGFRERLAGLVLPEDWQVLYFGCVFRDAPEVVQPGLLRVRGATWDMHGYMIRRNLWEVMAKDLAKASRRSGQQRVESEGTACDLILAEYHALVAAYAVWPPMAWQVEGLSNNENSVRGNYRKDGTQAIHREAIRGLPGVQEADMREGRSQGDKAGASRRAFAGMETPGQRRPANQAGQPVRSGDDQVGRGCARADSSVGGGGAEPVRCGDAWRADESPGVLQSARAQPRPTLPSKDAMSPGSCSARILRSRNAGRLRRRRRKARRPCARRCGSGWNWWSTGEVRGPR